MIGRNVFQAARPCVFKLALPVALLCSLGACGYITLGRPLTTDEIVLHQEIESYYTEVSQAFATANPQMLAELCSPSITQPMTQPQILAWAKNFFSQNKAAIFHIDKISFEELGYENAVVTLTYHVETPGGNGAFSGIERDTLVRTHGHWFVASWDKI